MIEARTSPRQRLEAVIGQCELDRRSLTIGEVAERAGVSRQLLYSNHVDLLERIRRLKLLYPRKGGGSPPSVPRSQWSKSDYRRALQGLAEPSLRERVRLLNTVSQLKAMNRHLRSELEALKQNSDLPAAPLLQWGEQQEED